MRRILKLLPQFVENVQKVTIFFLFFQKEKFLCKSNFLWHFCAGKERNSCKYIDWFKTHLFTKKYGIMWWECCKYGSHCWEGIICHHFLGKKPLSFYRECFDWSVLQPSSGVWMLTRVGVLCVFLAEGACSICKQRCLKKHTKSCFCYRCLFLLC